MKLSVVPLRRIGGIAAVTAFALAAACGTAARRPLGTEAPGIPESRIGLARGALESIPEPPPPPPAPSEPGEATTRPPAYPGAPPVIPHAVQDYLPITPQENLCLDCHASGDTGEGAPTPVPASHYEDLRRAPGRRSPQVVGARYVCVTCHAPATEAPPLVENLFRNP